MDLEQAIDLALALAQEMSEAAQVAKEAGERAAGASAALAGLRRMFPDLDEMLAEAAAEVINEREQERLEAPRGQEAVRQILIETPGVWYSVPLLVQAMQNRHWIAADETPRNAVRVAAERVVGADPERFSKERDPNTGVTVYGYWPNEVISQEASDIAAQILSHASGIHRRIEDVSQGRLRAPGGASG